MKGLNGVGGDLVPPGGGNKPCANETRVYLSCEGIIDKVIGRVEKAGGKIIAPKFKLAEVGWIANRGYSKEILSACTVSNDQILFAIELKVTKRRLEKALN